MFRVHNYAASKGQIGNMNNENNRSNENHNSGNHNEGRRMKNMLNSKLEYYYGCGMGRYGEVLHELFVHGKVNSHRTSSIPPTLPL